MATLLMPKATAVWLVENTTLSFEQISEFCQMHKLEVQAIADGEVAVGIVGLDPIASGQLTAEEIKRCEGDPRARLKMVKSDLPPVTVRSKGPRYTPIAKRSEKPDAIAYLIKNYPELQDSQIARLLGTTKDTIAKVRDRSHWNASNIKPQNPVLSGLCKQVDLDAALKRAGRRVERENKAAGIEEETSPVMTEGDSFAPLASDESIEFSQSGQQPDLDPDLIFKNMG